MPERWELLMTGYYHQDDRDEAVGQGCLFLLVLFLCVIMLSAWLLAGAIASNLQPQQSSSSIMNGSDAGANAVTKEQLRKEGYDV